MNINCISNSVPSFSCFIAMNGISINQMHACISILIEINDGKSSIYILTGDVNNCRPADNCTDAFAA